MLVFIKQRKNVVRLAIQHRRFSESRIWAMQRVAYRDLGVDAWGKGYVPFYLTNSTLLAEHYARIVMGYIADTSVACDEPVYIFDLGAGSGRFGYYFLKALTERCGELSFCYVMTDISSKNLDFLQGHRDLLPFVDRGVLDFAMFDGEESRGIPLSFPLRSSGVVVSSAMQPVVAIGNYFFDTLVHDFFRVEKGVLYEGCVPDEVEEGCVDFSALQFDGRLAFAPVSAKGFYPDISEADDMLFYSVSQMEGASFSFPLGALWTLQRLRAFSGDRLLFLAADHGYGTVEQVVSCDKVVISRQEHFSVPVNFPLLFRYTIACGGQVIEPSVHRPEFITVALCWGGGSLASIRRVFADTIDVFGPYDYWHLGNLLEHHPQMRTLETLLLFFKLGRWNPVDCYQYYDDLMRVSQEASEGEKRQIAALIDHMIHNFFPISPQEEQFRRALFLFRKHVTLQAKIS